MKKNFKLNLFLVAGLLVLLVIISMLVEAKSPIKNLNKGTTGEILTSLPQKGPYLSWVTENSIIVSWRTATPDISVVQYGLTGQYGNEKNDPNLKTSHSLTLTGLFPDTIYHYKVVFEGEETPDYTFRTAVSSNTAFEFIAYGDSRTQADTHLAVVNRMVAFEPYFILHTGDLVADGFNESDWVIYFSIICSSAVCAQKIPFYSAIGNHELESPSYYDYFYLLHNNPDSTESYYSFDYGNSHFICLDVQIPLDPSSNQFRWLKTDLWKAYSKNSIFVFMHDHPYCAGGHNSNLTLRNILSPLFEIYKVDLVLSGHSHFYQRNGPINGVNYLITGGGGAPLHTPAESSWTKYTEKSHHFVQFKIWADSLKFKMIRTDGSVGDSLIVHSQAKQQLICGDANLDEVIDIGDVVYIINYVFYNGSFSVAPVDVNSDGVEDIGDIVYLINYVFYGGTEPSCQ
jgi:hypothetical protein